MVALCACSRGCAPCFIGQQQLWLVLFCALWRLYSVWVGGCCCCPVVAGKLQKVICAAQAQQRHACCCNLCTQRRPAQCLPVCCVTLINAVRGTAHQHKTATHDTAAQPTHKPRVSGVVGHRPQPQDNHRAVSHTTARRKPTKVVQRPAQLNQQVWEVVAVGGDTRTWQLLSPAGKNL